MTTNSPQQIEKVGSEKKKYNNNDDGYLNPQVAVDGKGSMWLMKDGRCIQVGGKIKKAIAKVTNLTLWI